MRSLGGDWSGYVYGTHQMPTAIFILISLYLRVAQAAVIFHERVTGAVGAGNYSYYSLSTQGTTTIFLHPLLGDPDLYVAEKNAQPTFDLEKHMLQSTTCGSERIDIPHAFGRPVGIGVYGHPSHELSVYELEVRVEDTREDRFDDYSYADDASHSNPSASRADDEVHTDKYDHEESMLWTILVGVLKIFLEVLAS